LKLKLKNQNSKMVLVSIASLRLRSGQACVSRIAYCICWHGLTQTFGGSLSDFVGVLNRFRRRRIYFAAKTAVEYTQRATC